MIVAVVEESLDIEEEEQEQEQAAQSRTSEVESWRSLETQKSVDYSITVSK